MLISAARMGSTVQRTAVMSPTAVPSDAFERAAGAPPQVPARVNASAGWLTENRKPEELAPSEWEALDKAMQEPTLEQVQWVASTFETRDSVFADDSPARPALKLLARVKRERPELIKQTTLGGEPLLQALSARLAADPVEPEEMVPFFRHRWLNDVATLIFPESSELLTDVIERGYNQHGSLEAMAPPQKRALALWVTGVENKAPVEGIERLDATLKSQRLRRPRVALYMAVANIQRDRAREIGEQELGLDDCLRLGREILAGSPESLYKDNSIDLQGHLYPHLQKADPIALYEKIHALEKDILPRLEEVSDPEQLSRQELAEVQLLGFLRDQAQNPRWNKQVDRLFNRELKSELLVGARAGLALTQSLYCMDQLKGSRNTREVVHAAQWLLRLSDNLPDWMTENAIGDYQRALRSSQDWGRDLANKFPDARHSLDVGAAVLEQQDRGDREAWKHFTDVLHGAQVSGASTDPKKIVGLYRKVCELNSVGMSRTEALAQLLSRPALDTSPEIELDEDVVWIDSIPLERN